MTLDYAEEETAKVQSKIRNSKTRRPAVTFYGKLFLERLENFFKDFFQVPVFLHKFKFILLLLFYFTAEFIFFFLGRQASALSAAKVEQK